MSEVEVSSDNARQFLLRCVRSFGNFGQLKVTSAEVRPKLRYLRTTPGNFHKSVSEVEASSDNARQFLLMCVRSFGIFGLR